MNLTKFEDGVLNEIQNDRCKKLLWAVIQLAIDDACRAPFVTKPQNDSITAMRFLFSESLDAYLMWLDVDAQRFKQKLLEAMFSEKHDKFQESARRAFRANFKWCKRNESDFDNRA